MTPGPARAVVLIVTVAVCAALAVIAGPVFGVDAAVLLGVGALLVGDARRTREAAARDRELGVAVGLLESELLAGTPPPSALAAAALDSPRLARALTQAHGNHAAALLGASDRDLRRLGVAWTVGETAGVPLAGLLGTFGADLRSAAEQRRAVSVALAGAKSSALLLAGLPVLGIALGAAMGARPVPLLVETPAGRVLGCTGVMLDAAGVLWVRAILRRAERQPA